MYADKSATHDSFRQLIAQNRDGKIHALQISTESSIRAAQERSKQEVTGKLKDVACAKIDAQTEALISMIGENQVDYRFFIGFKLLVNEQEVTMKQFRREAKTAVSDFLHEVNHKLMGDFVSMSNEEIWRFQKMEKLLENKISRRFKVRRLDKDDFGYLIEHLYGQTGTAYEDYEYYLPKKRFQEETLVKYYDLIKPTRCLIEENQRYLKIEQEGGTVYAAYFTINSIVGELDFPSSEIFYYQQQQFTFPIDTSMNVEIVTNRKALSTVRNKKKELKDLDNHAWQNDSETSTNVVDALDSVNELESTLDQSKESMYKLSYVVRVTAPDLEELKRRCNEVKDFYDDLNVKLVRPFGDMLGLHGEFLPASKRYLNDYIQYVTSDFLAGLGFGATQMLGETEGIYIGYSLDTGRNVYLKPALASQGVKGSVTNALAAAFVGSLGGGKSFSNNMIVYYSVLFGAQALIVDPKAERGRWKETLPEIAHEINIVNLTSEEQNRGLLDPYVIMENPKDSESLAIDILTFLTGISSRDGEKFPVLRKAIRAVTNSEERGLFKVIEELRAEGTAISTSIADHIESFTDYDFAHLLFSDGDVTQSISLEKQLNIIQVADLVLPDKETSFEEYTTMELLSVAMLIVREYGIEEYLNVLLAIIQVESGGTLEDVMQSSESLGLPPNSLSTEESIKQGCKYFSELLAAAETKGCDLNSVIQSYNYGGGFLDYVAGRGKKYTFELAESFARDKSSGKKVTYTNPVAVEKNGGWRYSYGNMFYVLLVSQYLTVAQFDDETVQAIMEEALKYEGWTYVYGGDSPSTSFDCSGLVQWCYGKAGIALPRTAQEQYNVTQHIPLSEAKAGDLVFFHSTYNAGTYITHVGLYVGNNRMYHAGNPIGYADLTGSYWQQHLAGAGRIKQ